MAKKATKSIKLDDEDFLPDDRPSMFSSPYFRAVLNIISAVLLGQGFSSVNNSYFYAVTISLIALLGETLPYRPQEYRRIIIRRIAIGLMLLSLFIAGLGVLRVLQMETINDVPHIVVVDYAFFNGFGFPAKYLYIPILSSYFLSVVDVFTMNTAADKKLNGAKAA